MTAFEEMGVLPELGKAVEDMGWTLPRDIQAEAIPQILGGADCLMAAETGSGKTGAFCLPVAQIVWESVRDAKIKKNTASSSDSGGADEKWQLNIHDRGQDVVVRDLFSCQSRNQQKWQGIRTNWGITLGGCYQFEVKVLDEGLSRVGWSTPNATLELGTDRFGFGFGGTGKKSNNRQFDDYGEAFGKNDVIGCFIDLDKKQIWYTKNGRDLGLAFNIPDNLKNEVFFPAAVLKDAEVEFNVGQNPFCYSDGKTVPVMCAATENRRDKKQQKQTGFEKPGDVDKYPRALIIEPSLELARQTFDQLNLFAKHLSKPSLRSVLITGGGAAREQIASLKEGVDIVVGTPGRLEDLINDTYINLSQIRFFIMDEADALQKQGCEKQVLNMYNKMNKNFSDGTRLQVIVCSATCRDFQLRKFIEKLLHFYAVVDLKGEDAVPETVHHVVVKVDPQTDKTWAALKQHITTDGVHQRDATGPHAGTVESLSEAVKILKAEYCIKAIREHKMDSALIFCRTKVDCNNLESYFMQFGNQFSCVCLHADRKPQERSNNLRAFKEKKVRFLICTDVAARGIDISGLPFVINMTLPDDKTNYIHRVGRVGRAERMGLAISLVSTVPEKVWFHGEWCHSRGRNCNNTQLVESGGCCIWYNEMQLLADIEDHLNITIDQAGADIKVAMNQFDGKVVYGQKKVDAGSGYASHVEEMSTAVQQLAELERQVQISFLERHYGKKQ